MSEEQSTGGVDVGEEGAVATVPQAPPAVKPSVRKPRQLPPYKVLLHNDDVNTVEHVVQSVLQLTPLSPQEAIQRTLEADRDQVALLLVTHRERAELYHEQFTSLSITVTIEPDTA